MNHPPRPPRSFRPDVITWCLYAFLGLAILFVLAPLIIIVINSFNSVSYSSFPPAGFSLRWYENLLRQDQFLRAFWNSLVLGVVSTLLSLAVATLAALALVRHRIPGAATLHTFFLSPIVVPKMVLGLALYIFFLKLGLYGNPFSVILSHIVVTFPFALSVIYAGLHGARKELDEAAADLGAKPMRVFFDITLPQIRASLLVAGLFSFIISFDQVETTLFLVRGKSNTLPIEMFLFMERWQDPTMAALSTMMIAFTGILLLISQRVWWRFTAMKR